MPEKDQEKIAWLEAELNRVRGWLFEARNENATQGLELTRTRNQLKTVTESLQRSQQEREDYKKEAEGARRELYLALRAGIGNSYGLSQMDPRDREVLYVDNFLAGNELTARDLSRMFDFERAQWIPYLRRHAAYIYAIPNGKRPDREKFLAINSFLNIYDPKFGQNQLPRP